MRPRRTLTALLCAASIAAAAGCGGSGGSGGSSASDAAHQYANAYNRRDPAKVCDLYSEGLKRSLPVAAGNCPAFVEEQTSGAPTRRLEVVSVQESGDSATAELRTTGESGALVRLKITLARQDGDWRVTGLG